MDQVYCHIDQSNIPRSHRMMTPLRQRMIDDMRIRNFAEGTQRSYIHYVAGFAKYFNLSPELLDLEAVRQYQLFLNQERKLSPQSINCFVSAVQFLYTVTLEMPWKKEDFPRPRLEERLPVVPSLEEVEQFFDNLSGLENRAVLMTCYGAGLRIAEAVSVKIDDVDKQRMLLRVEQGKGGKDRYVMLSATLLSFLRAYFRILRPRGPWLFPSPWDHQKHISPGIVQVASRDAWQRCGLSKRISPHTLRHAFATHVLEDGTDIKVIQALLGHRRIETTAGYIDVSPRTIGKTTSPLEQLWQPAKPKPAKGKRAKS
jgi:integrase/recombinase XerD